MKYDCIYKSVKYGAFNYNWQYPASYFLIENIYINAIPDIRIFSCFHCHCTWIDRTPILLKYFWHYRLLSILYQKHINLPLLNHLFFHLPFFLIFDSRLKSITGCCLEITSLPIWNPWRSNCILFYSWKKPPEFPIAGKGHCLVRQFRRMKRTPVFSFLSRMIDSETLCSQEPIAFEDWHNPPKKNSPQVSDNGAAPDRSIDRRWFQDHSMMSDSCSKTNRVYSILVVNHDSRLYWKITNQNSSRTLVTKYLIDFPLLS